VVLIISDNGPGLSEDMIQTLYNSDRAISGKTGLGLHLIRDLAKAIACQISVQSEPGVGSKFRLIFLPVSSSASSASQSGIS
jgi:signal transduction histidine kinase